MPYFTFPIPPKITRKAKQTSTSWVRVKEVFHTTGKKQRDCNQPLGGATRFGDLYQTGWLRASRRPQKGITYQRSISGWRGLFRGTSCLQVGTGTQKKRPLLLKKRARGRVSHDAERFLHCQLWHQIFLVSPIKVKKALKANVCMIAAWKTIEKRRSFSFGSVTV